VAVPPLDSPCDGPVTYPGDIRTLVKSSKERSGPFRCNKIKYLQTMERRLPLSKSGLVVIQIFTWSSSVQLFIVCVGKTWISKL